MYLLLCSIFLSLFSLFVCVLFAFVYLCMRARVALRTIYSISKGMCGWGGGMCVCDAL